MNHLHPYLIRNGQRLFFCSDHKIFVRLLLMNISLKLGLLRYFLSIIDLRNHLANVFQSIKISKAKLVNSIDLDTMGE